MNEINFHEFVKNNSEADIHRLLLDESGKRHDFPLDLAVCQIECRRKTARKLAKWLQCPGFLFPCREVAEQSTHQCVAAYHASLVGCGKRILDITAGLGIDAFTLAESDNKVTAIELDHDRAEALRHNNRELGLDVTVIEGDSIAYLSNTVPAPHDIIFADPARRDADKKRVYYLKDCLPDITTNLNLLKNNSTKLFIKASPLLDLSQALREIPIVAAIHIVSVKGECKEVLLECDCGVSAPMSPSDVRIIVADLEETPDASLDFTSRFETNAAMIGANTEVAEMDYIKPGNYLYDPNAGIHKLNSPAALREAFITLKKVSPNTDLYVSDELIKEFPGRVFRIDSLPDRKSLKSLKGTRAEVVVRNYVMTADQLRKKLGVKSGDDRFVFGCRIGTKSIPTTILATKISN